MFWLFFFIILQDFDQPTQICTCTSSSPKWNVRASHRRCLHSPLLVDLTLNNYNVLIRNVFQCVNACESRACWSIWCVWQERERECASGIMKRGRLTDVSAVLLGEVRKFYSIKGSVIGLDGCMPYIFRLVSFFCGSFIYAHYLVSNRKILFLVDNWNHFIFHVFFPSSKFWRLLHRRRWWRWYILRTKDNPCNLFTNKR